MPTSAPRVPRPGLSADKARRISMASENSSKGLIYKKVEMLLLVVFFIFFPHISRCYVPESDQAVVDNGCDCKDSYWDSYKDQVIEGTALL